MLLPKARELTSGAARQVETTPNRIDGDVPMRVRRCVEWLPPLGLTLAFDIGDAADAVPGLEASYDYEIDFREIVTVRADTAWGAITALATVLQLSASDFAARRVVDGPRYPWRGLMLDVARRPFRADAVRQTLDVMWFYKLNVLHLHLSDDQAFRFASTAYPELASTEAYTGEELRALVDYAADRAIRIVPELDVPGHVSSWLLAHPEWGAGELPEAPVRDFGVHACALNPASTEALEAVRRLFAELADIFPDAFVHFGGDEVHPRAWSDESTQAWMRSQGFADPTDAQAFFNARVVNSLVQSDKRTIGWDEVLHENLDRNVVVQAWRDVKVRDVALAAGFDCIVSAPYYLDLFYTADAHYAFDPGGDLAAAQEALRKSSRMQHVLAGLDWMEEAMRPPEIESLGAASKPGRVLGGEACLWSELVSQDLLGERAWSRMPAIAERFWSHETQQNDLYARYQASRRLLAAKGLLPFDHPAADYPELAPLIELLEPVKWYRRLLGDAYQARAQGEQASTPANRPYDADSPLDRLIDHLPPESLASRHLEAAIERGDWPSTDTWRRPLEALSRYPEHPELRNPAEALCKLADVIDGTEHLPQSAIADLAGPYGEYLLPIAYAIAEHWP